MWKNVSRENFPRRVVKMSTKCQASRKTLPVHVRKTGFVENKNMRDSGKGAFAFRSCHCSTLYPKKSLIFPLKSFALEKYCFVLYICCTLVLWQIWQTQTYSLYNFINKKKYINSDMVTKKKNFLICLKKLFQLKNYSLHCIC